jgi:transposase-like protein
MQKRTYQQLQPEERMTIASMKQQGSSVQAIARTLGRAASQAGHQETFSKLITSTLEHPLRLKNGLKLGIM